jgi:anaerobic ribonucleoside-triphosphate reductase activating protein
MRYAGLIKNDMSAAPGISVSFFAQGCPHRCPNCHNPETWNFDGGKEFTPEVLDEICEALTANGIKRNFCLMGGEPLCPENAFLSHLIIKTIKEKVPETPIYIWSGYEFEKLIALQDNHIRAVLNESDYLIDGPYIEALRDVTLNLRGSSNQKIINLTEQRKNGII